MLERPHNLTPEKHALYVHARQIMGRPGGEHWDLAHRSLLDYSWREDEVRQAVDAPEDVEWFTRVLELEYHGLAGFRFYEPPDGSGSDSSWERRGTVARSAPRGMGGVLYSGGWCRGSRQMLWRGLRIVGGARGRIFMSSPLCLVRTCQPTAYGAPCAFLMTIHDDCEEEYPRLCNHRPCMTS